MSGANILITDQKDDNETACIAGARYWEKSAVRCASIRMKNWLQAVGCLRLTRYRQLENRFKGMFRLS